MRFSS